ncbi:restriction endonuclease subunit S [Clostridium gasigenes]|uniref:restriction endonuclease subunit S n=1 Tax=Clostridium gasigenes TaxID=94869 RepID=UPI001C0E1196|nr:restriction endonuclease subunit S [Clostridium gasigenes]MBU3135579.1 restriction endonuclease subunit S [Clostridium gasigenes]
MKYRYRNKDEMKDSGVEWLGEIPLEWEIIRSKYLWKKEKREINDNYGVITAFRDGEVTLRTNRRTEGFTFAIKEIGYQGVLEGDLVISAMDAFAGAMGISDSEGKCSPVYSVCSPLKELVPKYYKYILKEMSQKGYILSLAKGIRERSTDFRYVEFANTFLLYPNIEEQNILAKFIDEKTTQFDKIILKKEVLIKRLEEAKKSLISEVVTGKVKVVETEDVYELEEIKKEEMKDSGVEWLGEVPRSWGISRIKYEAKINARIGWKALKADEYVENGYVFLATPNIKGKKIDYTNVNYITKERYDESPELKLNIEDVLLTKDGSTLGTVNVVRDLEQEATVNSSIAVVRSNKNLNGIYLNYFIKSNYIQNRITLVKDGMGVPHLFQSDIKIFNVLLPSYDEQILISKYIDDKLVEIDNLINSTGQQIVKIKEAKQSLISEVVTGKIEILE